MTDASLVAFQLAEIADAIALVAGGFVFVLGVGIWLHATFWRSDEKD